MAESRTFYTYIGAATRDWLVEEFERGKDLNFIKNQLKLHAKIEVDVSEVAEAIVLSYTDLGESDIAYQLACAFRQRFPSPNMHNLVIRCLLPSWEYTQSRFLSESKQWAVLYADERNRPEVMHRNPRPRIGFVCDYGSTVFGDNAIFPMCQAMGKAGMDVYYYNFERAEYSVGEDVGSVQVRNVHDLKVDELSNEIMKDRIDILIDLNGRLRKHHRLGVFALRSAPVQVNYFNLVGTMGMQSYDYAIADEVQVPESDLGFYTEKILRLPCGVNGALSFKRDVEIPDPDTIGTGKPFTFASFNAFFKVNNKLLETWADILRRVPNSRIVIKCEEVARDRVALKIASVFNRAGIDLGRVMLDGWSSLTHMRRQYAEVDLCLDTFPYSGGSTTLNALWQAVPVLTWCGEGWRARTSASMLHAAGLGSLIVSSREEYVEMAVKLAANRNVLRQIRHETAASISRNPYFCPSQVYQELADALRNIWRSHPDSDKRHSLAKEN